MLKVANSVISASRIVGVLPVVNGGTGVTTSTGTGNTVLSATPTLSGDVTLSTGNLVPSTAGKGVNFTANTPSAGMTSQLLNWYEEGAWTPSIGGNAGGTATLSVAFGVYTRIGRQVTIKGRVEFSASTLSGGGIYFAGLPFTTNNTASSNSVGTLLAENIVYVGEIYSFINPNSTNMYLLAGATATGASALAGSAFGATSIATFSITYFI